MIIWLASYPRSGNTFCRLVLHKAFGLPTYSVYDESGVDDRQVELVGGAKAGNFDDLAKCAEFCVVKTHELPGNDAHPAIYIVRDGRDVVVSYATYIHNMQAKNASDRSAGTHDVNAVMRDLITHEQSFGGWGRHVTRWLERTPRPVVVEFGALIANPLQVVAQAMRDAGAPLHQVADKPLPTFETLRREMPGFFRSGRVGAFRETMPDHLQELFWQKYGVIMQRLGYER